MTIMMMMMVMTMIMIMIIMMMMGVVVEVVMLLEREGERGPFSSSSSSSTSKIDAPVPPPPASFLPLSPQLRPPLSPSSISLCTRVPFHPSCPYHRGKVRPRGPVLSVSQSVLFCSVLCVLLPVCLPVPIHPSPVRPSRFLFLSVSASRVVKRPVPTYTHIIYPNQPTRSRGATD